MAEKVSTLRILREQGMKPKVETLEKLKEQRLVKKKISECLKNEAKTIPQISAETSLPSPLVTWFIMTMLKYGEIREAGEKDSYYLYRLVDRGETK